MVPWTIRREFHLCCLGVLHKTQICLMICPHCTHAVSFKALAKEKIGVFSYHSCPPFIVFSWPEQQTRECSPTLQPWNGAWLLTGHEGMSGDLKVFGRGWNDGGRMQSTEIRLMYYDVSVRNLCTEMPHMHRIYLAMLAMWAVVKNRLWAWCLVQKKKKDVAAV